METAVNTHQYKGLTPEQYEELFSNFLFNSWSFSKLSSYARNEKAFEMSYIYNMPYKRSSSEVAGTAYHAALKLFFNEYKNGIICDLSALQIVAFAEIDKVQPFQWKVQKTSNTIEACISKANDICTSLLNNFLSEVDTYLEDIEEILEVEMYYNEFLTISGVDIMLPCHAVLDLKVLTKSQKVAIIDHKSKAFYSDSEEIEFSIGKQAITYILCSESKFPQQKIDEVWFVENKYSQNKDKSPQLNLFKIELNKDNRRLYEPLKRMLESISNPNYIYLINENDMFVSKAELYNFWVTTMTADVGDFNIPEDKKDLIGKRLKKIRDVGLSSIDSSVIKKFKEKAASFIQYDLSNKDMTNEEKISHTLRTLNFSVKVAHTFNGYSSNTYLLEISAGTNISGIMKYKLDIASALNVSSVRILPNLFVYNEKAYVAIEAAKKREKNLIFDPALLHEDQIPLGLDNFNQLVTWRLSDPTTPHLLVAGASGSGKSVFIMSTIEYAKLAGVTSLVLFDPKFELTAFASSNTEVLNNIDDIEKRMEELVIEMNELIKSGQKKTTLVVFDEIADAFANSRTGNKLDVYEIQEVGNYKDGSPKMQRVKTETKKSLEENLRLLLQKGRSVGYRIIAATQRPSARIINGDSKANFGVIISFRLPKSVDSKVVIDEEGAEGLSGMGDGLIKSPNYFGIIRFQSFFKQ